MAWILLGIMVAAVAIIAIACWPSSPSNDSMVYRSREDRHGSDQPGTPPHTAPSGSRATEATAARFPSPVGRPVARTIRPG